MGGELVPLNPCAQEGQRPSDAFGISLGVLQRAPQPLPPAPGIGSNGGLLPMPSSTDRPDDSAQEAAARAPELGEVYGELRALAARYLQRERIGHTLQPTALVHEAYLRLSQQEAGRWQNSGHFYALAASVMRRVLVDHARRRQATKRAGVRLHVTLSDLEVSQGDGVNLLALDAALDELQVLSPRQARVVELRFFVGMTLEEVAVELELARSTVAADWQMARAWLNLKLTEGDR